MERMDLSLMRADAPDKGRFWAVEMVERPGKKEEVEGKL